MSTTATARRVNDQVYVSPATSPKWHGVWTIDKVNPTTYALTRNGGAQRLKAPHSLVEDVPDGMIQTGAGTAQTVDLPAYREPYCQGRIVLWHQAPPKTGGSLFVVVKDDGDPNRITRLVVLGGDGGRYWRNIPVAQVSPVDVKDLPGLLG